VKSCAQSMRSGYEKARIIRFFAQRVVGIEPTHQPWEGRRLPLHHTRARRRFRFEHVARASYSIRLIDRARTIAIVTSEIIASTAISAFAQRLSGKTSAGLNAVAFVNAK
jgi:hypothetical protein